MKHRYLWLSILLTACALGMAVYLYPRMPERIPLHYDWTGAVDRYGDRALFFIWPAVMAALIAIWALLARLSPARFKVDDFLDTYWYCLFVVIALLSYSMSLSSMALYDHRISVPRAVTSGLAVLLALVGNVMGKVRPNFWLGVRTPWTLASPKVWYATHRLAGKTMVAGGLLALAMVLAGLPPGAAMATLIAAALAPAVYSWFYYRKVEKA